MRKEPTWKPRPPVAAARTRAAWDAYCALGQPGLSLHETDPEFADIMNHFVYGDIPAQGELLTAKQRALLALVSLVAQQSRDLLQAHAQAVLRGDALTAVELKEAVYHCVPYVGFPRVVDALHVVNEVLADIGVALPLPEQSTTNEETRFEKGLDAQATIFGDRMRQIAAGGPDAIAPTSYYLVSNCFGDYYTRGGLDLATRELLTLAILCNLGTESQIKSHITGNANMGQSKALLAAAMIQCLPYMGYPRLLNALGCLDEALPDPPENERSDKQ